MDSLKQILTQFSEIVRRMSVSQVVMLLAIIVGTIVGVVAVAGWLGQVEYQPLYTNLDPAEAGEIVQYLSDNKIPYRLTSGGGTIEVPEKHLYEARLSLASRGLPHSGTVGYSIFDQTNLGMTDFVQKLNYRRALEGELSRTITSLSEVKAARVHIVIPEEHLFADQQQEATASVVLKMRRAGSLAKSQIAGITHLVSSSVEGLKPGNITIVDSDGNMLASPTGSDAIGALTATQLEMNQTIEKDLERKAQSMLDGVLGPGKSIVRVSAELNFNQYSKMSENYDPNMVAIRSEQKTENADVASKKSAQNAEDKQDNRSNVLVTNYEVSKTVETLNNAVGTIKRLSVAVLLDGTYKAPAGGVGGDGALVYEPRPQEEMDRLGAIVKNAVGFSTDRTDQLEIVNIAFDKSYLHDEEKQLEEQYSRDFYYEIGKKVVVGLFLALGAFFAYRILRKFFAGLSQVLPPQSPGYRPAGGNSPVAPIAQEEIPEVAPESRQPKLVDRMQRAAKEDPEEIARVIKTMMVE